MKTKVLFAWLLCIICMSALAQTSELEYRLFAVDGKKWESQVGLIPENIYGNYISGDTMINGENWKKVYNYTFFSEDGTYYAAIRDFGKKVYAIARGSSNPRLLYNFDLKVGNIVRCGVEGNAFGCLLDAGEKLDTLLGFPFEAYLRLERIDTIKAQGLEYRRFILSLLDAFQEHFLSGENTIIGSVVWIEGIGSGASPFSPWSPLPPRDTFFQSCYIKRTCIFAYPDFYEADTQTAVNHLSHETLVNDLYDLQGRKLEKITQPGIYIKDGLKVLVK